MQIEHCDLLGTSMVHFGPKIQKFNMTCPLNENLYFSVCDGIKMGGELYIIIFNR